MKKSILFTTVVAVMSLASCKKDRTCTCTTTTSPGLGTSITIDTESHLTKKEGKRVLNCYSFTSTYTFLGGIITTTQTCTLK